MGEASATIGDAVSGAASFSEAKTRKIKAYFERRNLGHLLPEAALRNIKNILYKGPEHSRSAVFYALCVVGAAQRGVIERFGLNLSEKGSNSSTYEMAKNLERKFVAGEVVGDGEVHNRKSTRLNS